MPRIARVSVPNSRGQIGTGSLAITQRIGMSKDFQLVFILQNLWLVITVQRRNWFWWGNL